ncbi:MAG: Na+/H+ antiporter subunit E [Pseudomonas sp.]|nr:Na+/H+ antiporter subunit E [Pseudomonas sp.]MDD2224200.1 Na+/H+ antiporter subunit E [Pseudomonas sp.]MDY0414568.1 Na+/H+ antiporter subunit E [Pseudomonas sp.]NLO54137.1 Na+/H+ antiporter subunit E [Gammaproteobacteria bacterium]
MSRARWFTHPLGSIGLLLVWMLLVDDFTSVGHWLLGSFLGILIPRVTSTWWPRLPRIYSWKHLFVFAQHMLIDIVVANFHVARLALSRIDDLQPLWVQVPYDLDEDLAIYLLASAISLAPGTLAASIDHQRSVLTVHALHCDDEQALIAEIKQRYEQPLREAFKCLPQ